MITNECEVFTADEAFQAGISKAIREGSCIIEGSFKMMPDGFVNYEFKKFTFIDNVGNLRLGKLMQTYFDEAELSKLSSLIISEKTT